jgi:chromosome segregation ATPase
MAPAGKVDRKMKGRLQSGGAVLWFLRKHAPMPTPFSTLTPLEPFSESHEVSQPQAEVPPRPNTSCGFSLDNPQQQFLHNAVKCIGTELEEMHPVAAPLMRVRRGQTNAHRNRQALRQAFAKHSESECDRLRHEVSQREAEVRDLRLKVQQMERWVQATKHATQKRNARAKSKAASSRSGTTSISASMGSHNVRKSGDAAVGEGSLALGSQQIKIQKENSKPTRKETEDSFKDDVSGTGGEDNKQDAVKRAEEWQQAIARQSEVVKSLKTKIQEAQELLNQSTVHKKSMETGLFLAESEVLKLRALAKKAEERSTQLANELKRVYQDLPKVMEKRISVVAQTTSLEVKQKQLEKLKGEYREEHFKFLDNQALVLENEALENRIAHLGTFVEQAQEFLHGNREIAKGLEKRAQEARESMGFLQQVWTKMVKRALEVQAAPVGIGEDLDEGPELLLYRAGSGLDQCVELLNLEGRIELESNPNSRSPSPTQKKLGHSTTTGFTNTQSTRVPSPSMSSTVGASSPRAKQMA